MVIDYLKQVAIDIVNILANPPSKIVPSLEAGNLIKNTLLKLATLLKRVDLILELGYQQERILYNL